MTTLILLACSTSPPIAEVAPAVSPPAATRAARPAPLPPPMERAAQDPECMIQETMTLALEPTQEGVEVAQVNEVGHSSESFTFPDGTPVRYTQGGCVHYGMTLTVGLASKPEDPYAEALKQGARVRFTEDGGDLIEFVARAGTADEQGWVDCGDATCQVRVEEEAGGVQLIVSYDFPL
jgi:hypothetical protein